MSTVGDESHQQETATSYWRHASITGKGCSGRWHTLTRSPASVESYLPVRCLVPVERKRTHLPENDEEASERAPMHFEIFPRVVQYRRSVSVAAGEPFGKFLWTGYV